MNEDGFIEEAMLELCGSTNIWDLIHFCEKQRDIIMILKEHIDDMKYLINEVKNNE